MGDVNKPYRPGNGTEGDAFISSFCMNCKREKLLHTGNVDHMACEILGRTMVYDTNDDEYPEQWQYDDEGQPTCTAHVYWDWSKGDPEPEPYRSQDPNQTEMEF